MQFQLPHNLNIQNDTAEICSHPSETNAFSLYIKGHLSTTYTFVFVFNIVKKTVATVAYVYMYSKQM